MVGNRKVDDNTIYEEVCNILLDYLENFLQLFRLIVQHWEM